MFRTLTRLAAAFAGWRGSRPHTTQPRRLTLEALEDRTLLSTLVIDPKNIIISATAPGPMPQFNLANPASGGTFGSQVKVLPDGNIIVTDPTVNNNAGAVYLFNGTSGALIGTLSGNAGDQLGSGAITPLPNGNVVVTDPRVNNNAGAVYLFNGTSGALIGTLSGNAGDQLGSGGITPLPNSNVVVTDPAVKKDAGAVYLINGTTGALISTLSGSTGDHNGFPTGIPGDNVGSGGVTVLANGNYVISSPLWNGHVGAMTWGSATAGVSGPVSATNSLTGTAAVTGGWWDPASGQGVANYADARVVALTNGNYLVVNPSQFQLRGAVTWANGTTGIVGTVSDANSLVGATAGGSHVSTPLSLSQPGVFSWSGGDQVGSGGVAALANGNYVVGSPGWNSSEGAATWANGATGLTGSVTVANSLVGSTPNAGGGSGGDSVGTSVTALSNGNYVVGSPYWNLGRGAVTWGDGTAGLTGPVSAANSLVGHPYDYVGIGVTALTNGNYVVSSPYWDGTKGAATWASGAAVLTGTVTAANSLVGSQAFDQVGGMIYNYPNPATGDVTALANGNYVVASPFWNGKRGAATWGSGAAALVGTVSAANSLIGAGGGDQVSSGGITALTNGNYVVGSPLSSGQRGAATWGSGTAGVRGPISEVNSLVGASALDQVGGVTALPDGNYVLASPNWNGHRGAATWVDGGDGTTLDGLNTIDAQNSLLGAVANAGLHVVGPGPRPGTFVAGFTHENDGRVTIGEPGTSVPTAIVSTAFLAQQLAAGTDVVLKASNDITVSAPLTVTPSGTAGSLTLQAGRSILVNGSIATGGGNLTLTANDTVADGVADNERDPGNAAITEAAGVTLDAGTGALAVDLRVSTDKTNNGQGVATLLNLTAAATALSAPTALGVTINGTTAGNGTAGTYSQVNVTGGLILNGAALAITHGAATAIGNTFTIAHTTAGVAGTFRGIAEGALVFAGDGTPFTITYHANGNKDIVLTQVASPFAYDAASQTLTVTLDAPQTGIVYSQATTQAAGGALHSTYTVAVANYPVSYTDAQLQHIVLTAHDSGDYGVLITNDTYVGNDGMTHESHETVWMRPGGGILYKYNGGGNASPFVQLNGFATSYAYVGPADDAEVTGVTGSGVENFFVTGGGYSYVVGGGEFHFVSGARYVYGYAANAADQAWHYDSAGGLNAFVASGNAYSYMSGSDPAGNSFFNVAVGFQVTYGISTHRNAIAYLVDSPGNDVFFGGTSYSYLYSANADGRLAYFDLAEGFALVFAESFVGGTDFAYNYDHNHNILGGNWILLT
jgi:hypothetical protein